MKPRDRTFFHRFHRGGLEAYVISATICAALWAVPFLAVTVPPITDLPQQTAQIRLLLEALDEDESPYRVQWTHPNKLGYLPLLAAWPVAGPLAAGRLGLYLIAVLQIGAVHALARASGRHPATAIAASMFISSHVFYWGFLSFLIGFPVFILWFLWLRRSPPVADWLEGPVYFALAALLYSAHVLWLAAGVVAVVAFGLSRRWPPRSWTLRSLWLLPAAAAVAVWYPTFTAGGFDSPTTWGHTFFQRLHPGWLVNSALGGLQGPVEAALLAALLGWLVLGWWQSRARVERGLAAAALGFTAAALALPSVHQHTIFFASRWIPIAAVFATLACPPPRLRPFLLFGFPLFLLATLSAATTSTWIAFEDEELDGFYEALSRLPPAPRLLGLDFIRTSERIRGFPTYHFYAYGQALRGGELSRTFANEASSLVVYEDLPRPVPWTPGLDWQAWKVRRSDVPHFDFVLIHGRPADHAVFLADPRLRLVTGLEGEKRWRLYKVEG